MFGINGLVGVNGRYFYTGFFVREVVEIMLAVVTIVLNASSSVIVELVMRKQHESTQRFTN